MATVRPRWKRTKTLGLIAAIVVVLGLISALLLHNHLNSKINVVDTAALEQPEYTPIEPESIKTPGGSNPEKPAEGSLNYMLIGSDSRSGSSWGEDGARSDTTIIMHISADRKNIDLVSIPRDSIVDIPPCALSEGGQTSSETNGMFNSAFTKGDSLASSVACTQSTIEKNTGLEIDGFTVVDFAGFEEIVDALGGVKMDVPEDMKSKKSGLSLKKGEQTLNGEEALAYARARTMEVGPADGSDIGRIDRQQELLEAIAKQTLSRGTLTNPSKLYDVIDASLDSASFSEDLGSGSALSGLAYELRSVDSEDIEFHTVPVTEWPEDPNRVIWTDEADEYWEALKNDEQIKTQ